MREPAYLKQKQPIFNKLLSKAQTSYADGDLHLLVMFIFCSLKPPQYTKRGLLDISWELFFSWLVWPPTVYGQQGRVCKYRLVCQLHQPLDRFLSPFCTNIGISISRRVWMSCWFLPTVEHNNTHSNRHNKPSVPGRTLEAYFPIVKTSSLLVYYSITPILF